MLTKEACQRAITIAEANPDTFGSAHPFEYLSPQDKDAAMAIFFDHRIKGNVSLNDVVRRYANGTENTLYKDYL